MSIKMAPLSQRLGGSLLGILLRPLTLHIGYLIWSIILWKEGDTPTKKILKMKIISSQTLQPLTSKHLALRQVGIPFAYFGAMLGVIGISIILGIAPIFSQILIFLIWMIWTLDRLWIFKGEKRQRLTDVIMKTYVVSDDE